MGSSVPREVIHSSYEDVLQELRELLCQSAHGSAIPNKYNTLPHRFCAYEISRRCQRSCTEDMSWSDPHEDKSFPIGGFKEVTRPAFPQQKESVSELILACNQRLGGKSSRLRGSYYLIDFPPI